MKVPDGLLPGSGGGEPGGDGASAAGGAGVGYGVTRMPELRLLIGGELVEAAKGGRREATSPGHGEVFASVAWGERSDAERAVEVAAGAAPGWARTTAAERAARCHAAAAAVERRRADLVGALTEDQGKPLAEAADEVDELVAYFRLAGEDASRVSGVIPPSVSPDRRAELRRVPLGVVGVVVPWNWPYTMAAELVAPALAAGNTVVWVPAPSTTACSLLLAGVLAEAGWPPGVLNVVSGDGPEVGDAVVSHPLTAAVGFVGSVATGRRIAARAAGKAQILELGGNGPLVVLDDADLDLVVPAVLESAYLCAGQSCTAGGRFLVDRSLRAALVDAVVGATDAEVVLGDPTEPGTTMGPLNNEGVAAKVGSQVAEAVGKGARLIRGGRREAQRPTRLYYQPTILDGVEASMTIAGEETFGPVVPVVEVAGDQEALALTNSSPYGLLASVFTSDLERGLRFAEGARTGWVNVNLSTNTWESHLPFGGRSGSVSGTGRVGGSSVLERFSEWKTILYRMRGAEMEGSE